MLRLFKYLKPYTLLILIAIGLLFVQANADLALPDYMSKIVNDGIQQGGVVNAVPRAIRQSEMNKLAVFLAPADKQNVLNAYTLVESSSPDYSKYAREYPSLNGAAVYILKSISKSETNTLNTVMGKALLSAAFLQQVMADPSKAAAMAAASGFDLSKVPAGTDLFTVLEGLDESQLAPIRAAFNTRFDTLGSKMVSQMAVGAVKLEYTALGLNTSKLQTNYILHTGLLMLLVTLLSVTCTIIVGFLAARTASGFARDLRKGVFKRVESFSSVEFDKFSTASLITRTTNDVTQIQMVVFMMLRMVIYAPIIGVGGVIRAIGKSADMWWIIALGVVLIMGMIGVVFAISLPKFKAIQGLIDRLNLVTRENLAGMMVIRAFNMQDFEEKRFDKANVDLTSTNLFVNRIMVIMFPFMMTIMNAITLLIIWVGAHQVAQSHMQVGDMMAFLQYAMQIMFSFLMLSFMFIIIPRASVSGGRIADVLETEPAIHDPEQPKQFREAFRGTVEFRNVSFRYPGAEEDILHNISFLAKPGQTTAFIGTTGSGKSTIVSLIPRFYEVTDGAILVDGVDVRSLTQHDLREKIGYVPQKSSLFTGTIETNLRYADENASEEALKTAADIAQATEFIDEKPEGLATEIAQGGMNVSGGQKQRLAIARALVKKPPIYIFDDSFSALDFKTDSSLRKALKQKTGDSTVFIVTQRVPTIKNSDQIIVLDEGRIVGKGRHEQLMKTCEVYREIALSQVSQEELA